MLAVRRFSGTSLSSLPAPGRSTVGRFFLSWCLALALALTVAPAASAAVAQVDTGAVVIRVLDPEDEPLPGASVALEGPQLTRTDVAGDDGTVRFAALLPGRYRARIERDGFRPLVREGLRVSIGRNLIVRARMELAGLEETVTVTGRSPMVDTKAVEVGVVYGEEMIEGAPTSSGLWGGILAHVPGVVLNEYDIGGARSTSFNAQFSSRGTTRAQNTHLVNGSLIEDPRALSAQPSLYYSTASFEEVQVSTASHDIEFQKPGAVVNIVTKSGTNVFHGGSRFFFEDGSFKADNLDAELEERGADKTLGLSRLEDLDLQLGGPVLPDRAWFFVDYWRFNLDREKLGLPEGVFDETELDNWTFRLGWQPTSRLRISGDYVTGRKFRPHGDAGRFTPLESSVDSDEFTDVFQLQGQYVTGDEGLLDVRFSRMDQDIVFVRRPDAPSGQPGFDFFTGMWFGPPALEGNIQRDRSELRANYSHYLAGSGHNHDLKFGARVGRIQGFEPFFIEEGLWRFDFAGDPFLVWILNTPKSPSVLQIEEPDSAMEKLNETSFFLQDAWTLRDRVTVTAGLRFDASTGWLPQQNRPDSFFSELGPNFQAASFPRQDGVTEWRELSPRVSVTYDLFGDGRWALEGSYSRYVNNQTLNYPANENRNSVGLQEWFWSDLDGDGEFDVGEQTFMTFEFFPGDNNFVADDFSAPVTEEFTLGVEHELVDDVRVSATAIVREAHNLVAWENAGVPFDQVTGAPSYELVTVTDPGPDGIVGTEDDGGPFQVFEQVDNFGGDLSFLVNPEKRGFRFPQTYRGLDVVVEKRWSDNWQLLASWTVQKAEGLTPAGGPRADQVFFGFGAFNDPNRGINAAGEFGWSRRHLFRVTANYLFPEPWGVNVGVFYRHESGYPWAREFRTRLKQGRVTVFAEKRGARRAPSVDLLDLRAEKQFTLPGRWGVLHAYLDMFNLFNSNTATDIINLSGPRFDNVVDFLDPRVFRVGAAWNF